MSGRAQVPAHAPLRVNAWWSMTTTALRDLERAREFGVNLLIIENDVDVEWNRYLDGLATYDFLPAMRRIGEERDRVMGVRARLQEILARARATGIQTAIMCPEVHVPRGFRATSFDNPELWTLLRSRLREIFQALPELDGFLLYLCEGEIEVVDLPGESGSPADRMRKLVATLWEACLAEGRRLYVATFIHRPDRLEALAAALRSLPAHPDFSVLQYCCPNDWGLYRLRNPVIGSVGGHPEIIGFDYAAENWGQGAHPFVHVDLMSERVGEALRRSTRLVGIAGYVGWYGRSVLGTLNEANVYAGSALARQPGRPARIILRDWCAARFGQPAARTAAACLARTQEIVLKAQHVLGYWLDTANKSGLPTLAELDEYFVGDCFGEALASWDAGHGQTWRDILHPHEAFLRSVLAEKEQAVALCRRSLAEIARQGRRFRPADCQLLERSFRFQELWARIWRDYVHAFFLRRMARHPELPEVMARLAREADELERSYGADVFPRGPGVIRRYLEDLRAELGPA